MSRLVNAHEAQEQVSVADVLTHAIDHGHPQLAQEAQTCFDQNGYKAGRQSDHPAPEALLVPDQESHEEGQHEDELMQKAWKDAAYGAALMVDPETPEWNRC